MEDFGTAGLKLLPNFRNFCIGRFKPDIFIPVRRHPVHYQGDRREARKLTTLIGLINVRKLRKTMMGEENLFQ